MRNWVERGVSAVKCVAADCDFLSAASTWLGDENQTWIPLPSDRLHKTYVH